MTTTGGRRRAEPAKRDARPVVALGAVIGGVVLGAVAWFFLVRAAIDFGGRGRDGDSLAWVFLGLATLGAIACLILVLVLVGRGLAMLGLRGGNQVPATGGGHRRLGK